jgi:NAD+ diphosphatase
MTFAPLTGPQREASQFVGFAGNRIDRQSENRSDESLAMALADPLTRVMQSRGGRLYIKVSEAAEPNAYFSVAEATEMGAKLGSAVLLGMSDDGPVVVAPGSVDPDDLPESIKAIDHRSIYTQGLLSDETTGEMAQGAALLTWHHTHRFCGRCGGATEMRIGGYKRVCTQCQAEHFPRTDPVVIMLSVKGDRCVLGRSPHFAPGMYSALAGFIEPGETIENAVRRETQEEAGIDLGRVAYHASQPWPFPHTLMIGCYGEALNDDISFDGKELEDCRWFSREEVRSMLAGTHPEELRLPPAAAIAHHLIRFWAEAE